MPVRFVAPLLYNSLLMRSSTVPVSLILVANGARRRTMSSYRSYGRELEMHLNAKGTIFNNLCPTNRIVFVYVTLV